MEPISLAIGAVGLGMQIFGGLSSASNARQQASVSSDIAGQEYGINNAKQAAMDLQGRRTQLENVRNIQRARAQGTEAAVSQGAQFGSGLQGGLAQVTDQGLFNMQGVNDALQTGHQIAGYNNTISSDKMQLATLGGQAATDQGISSLGGALMKSGPVIGQLGQNAYSGLKGLNLGQGLFGGGSPSGY